MKWIGWPELYKKRLKVSLFPGDTEAVHEDACRTVLRRMAIEKRMEITLVIVLIPDSRNHPIFLLFLVTTCLNLMNYR